MRDTSPPPSAAGGVVAFATSESAMAALSRAVALLRSAYGAAGVALSRSGLLVRVAAAEHDRFDASNPVLSHAEEVELVRRVAQRAPHAAQRLVFTGCGLADNWFAHWHRDARTTVVSLYDWQQLSPAPVEAFVGCELVLHGLRALSERYDPGRLLHEQARGCLFDFCQQKAEVNHKLRRASVCVECRAKLTGLNVSVPTVSRMLETVRQMLTAE